MARSWLFTKQAKVLYAAAVVVNTLAVALLACLATCCYFAMFVDLRNRSVTTGDAVDGSIGSGPPRPPPPHSWQVFCAVNTPFAIMSAVKNDITDAYIHVTSKST